MSGRNDAAKRTFHSTTAQAVSTRLGSSWETVGPGDDCWTARFARRTTRSTHLLQLKLAVPHHVVEVTLAVELDPNVLLPEVWWEDRSLHSGTSGFKKVLWRNDLAYGTLESVTVPKEPWIPEFNATLEEWFRETRERMESWYSEAEDELCRKS